MTGRRAGAIDYFRWGDKLRARPNYSGPNIFYNNKNLLQQAGLPDPWEQYQKGEWTIQRYAAAVQRLTRGQAESREFGTREISRSIRNQSLWIQGFGDEVWNARATETLLNGDGTVRAWEYQVGLALGLTAPTTRALARSPAWLNQLVPGEQARAYEAAAIQVKAILLPPRLSEIDKLIQEAYARVIAGQATAKQAMTEIKPQADAILGAAGR